jgi:hypothetical protein
MESIRVFVGRHGFENHPAVDVLRQWELDQNAMNLRIGIFLFD